MARTAGAIFVRDYLGHAKLTTTGRYVGAKFRPEDFERLNRAYAATASSPLLIVDLAGLIARGPTR